MIRKLFWVALILLLGGCSGFSAKDNADPPAELVERQAELAVETLWQQQVGGTDGRFLAIAPALDGELIYIANAAGQVSAIERAGGKTRWQRDTGLPITGGPGVGEGLVLVGTAEAELLALSGETGEELWRRRVSSEVLARPVVGQGVVVARTINGRVAGFDLTSGQPRLGLRSQRTAADAARQQCAADQQRPAAGGVLQWQAGESLPGEWQRDLGGHRLHPPRSH